MERVAPPIESLRTERLVLRPLVAEDAPSIVRLCGHIEVAKNTLTIPHPYSLADAHAFLGRMREAREQGKSYVWAITLASPVGEPGEQIGVIGMHCEWDHLHAEVGYNLGTAAWGRGYATESLRALVRFAFTRTPLVRLNAGFYTRNPASGRVLEKCSFVQEGLRRSMYQRFGERVDVALTGLFKENWVDRPN